MTDKQDERDSKILKYTELIAKKREELKELNVPKFVTNMSYPIDNFDTNRKINLRVLNDIGVLIKELSKLKSYKENYDLISAELKIEIPFELGGYSYNDWEHDFKALISKANMKKLKDELDAKERALKLLISENKKKDIEVDELINGLDGIL